MDSDIQKYIQQRRDAGWEDKYIRKELSAAGWSTDQIDSVLYTPQIKIKKSKSKTSLFIVIVVAILIIGGGAFGAMWYVNKSDEQINANTIEEINSNSVINSEIDEANEVIDSNEPYLACGCGCCGGTDPIQKCLYKSKGDDLDKIIAEDKLLQQSDLCPFAGCSIGVEYKYCDPPNINDSDTISGVSTNTNIRVYSNTNSDASFMTSTNDSSVTLGSDAPTTNTITDSDATTDSDAITDTNTSTGSETTTTTNTNSNTNTNTTVGTPLATNTTITISNGIVSTQCVSDSDCVIIDSTNDRSQCCYIQECSNYTDAKYVSVNKISLSELDSTVYDVQSCFFSQCLPPSVCSSQSGQLHPTCLNSICTKQ